MTNVFYRQDKIFHDCVSIILDIVGMILMFSIKAISKNRSYKDFLK